MSSSEQNHIMQSLRKLEESSENFEVIKEIKAVRKQMYETVHNIEQYPSANLWSFQANVWIHERNNILKEIEGILGEIYDTPKEIFEFA